MASKIQTVPSLPRPIGRTDWNFWGTDLIKSMIQNHFQIATRLNKCIVGDGSEVPTGPVRLPSYAVADLPDAGDYPGSTVFVTDETDGAVLAFSDGTNWRRATDRGIVSA